MISFPAQKRLGQNGKDKRITYSNFKEQNNIKIKDIEKTKKKRRYRKIILSRTLEDNKNFEAITKRRSQRNQEDAKKLITTLNSYKGNKNINQKDVTKVIQVANIWMRDVNKMTQDLLDLIALENKEVSVFLVTAKPVAE